MCQTGTNKKKTEPFCGTFSTSKNTNNPLAIGVCGQCYTTPGGVMKPTPSDCTSIGGTCKQGTCKTGEVCCHSGACEAAQAECGEFWLSFLWKLIFILVCL